MPDIRFHGLRHTHAALMLKRGVHPKIVSERLSHSPAVPGLQKEAMEKFADHLVFGKEMSNVSKAEKTSKNSAPLKFKTKRCKHAKNQ